MLKPDEKWNIYHGDCIPHMAEDMEPESMDFSVFSPPFPSLFCYTSEESDIGNTTDLRSEGTIHLSFFFKALKRVMKPGRVVIVHVMNIPPLARNGEKDTFDFRGMCIRVGQRAGFTYDYDWCIRKNPQAQAIRTHSHKLLFVQMERDRTINHGAYPDYLIKFRAPGVNKKPVCDPGQVSRNNWIDWAECAWMDIKETDTLNTKAAKSESDVKHICPLQLGVIERCVRLFSDPGEVVFSPFAGIGSEGYVSLKFDRRFYGCELKPEYHAEACRNLRKVEVRSQSEMVLF